MVPLAPTLMTFARLAGLVLLLLWGIDAITWARDIPSALAWTIGLLRLGLFGLLAVTAVRRGRRWSSVPLAYGIATLALLGPVAIGILSGDFAARYLGPARVFAFLALWIPLAFVVVTLACGATLFWHRRQRRSIVGAI
jgi:hypothetical protein